MNLDDIFDLKLDKESEVLLQTYTGVYVEHYDENGLIGTQDTRIPELEKLFRKKQLKQTLNVLFLKYAPLSKQLDLLSGSLSPEDEIKYKERIEVMKTIYSGVKDRIEEEEDMDKMYEHISAIGKSIQFMFGDE